MKARASHRYRLRVASPTVNSTFDDNDAIVGLGGNYALTKFLATADTFGKASETVDASTMEAFVYNMSLSSNLEVQEIIAPNGDFGVAQVRYVAGVLSQLKCTIDQVMWSQDWDLYSFMNNANGIRSQRRASQAQPPTSSFSASPVRSLTSCEAQTTVYRNVEFTLDYLYPENSDDGDSLPQRGSRLST